MEATDPAELRERVVKDGEPRAVHEVDAVDDVHVVLDARLGGRCFVCPV